MSTCLHKLSCHSNVDIIHGHYGHAFSGHVGIHQGECKHGGRERSAEKGGGMVIMVKWSREKNRAKNGDTLSLFVYIYNLS